MGMAIQHLQRDGRPHSRSSNEFCGDRSWSVGSAVLTLQRHQRVKVVAMVAPARQQVAENSGEAALVEALIGVQGRGWAASSRQLQDVAEAVSALEAAGGVPDPTGSTMIEGRWQLMYTTRPGTASPIQRTFVGVDAFSVFQEIVLRGTDDPRVNNIVRFSEKIGELKVEAAASVDSGKRILFRFDKAAFSFKFLPFKVPYPVPFKLLGDEAKGWLDTTYLSPQGNIRISKGNKGTTFVLQKDVDPRQRLLRAIAINNNVEKEIDELIKNNPTKAPTDLSILAGKWRLLWSSQTPDANWLQKATSNIPNWQIVKPETGRLENLVRFLPGVRLRAKARSEAVSETRRSVNIEGADLELGSFKFPLKISAEGYTDILYIDSKMRIARGNKGSVFVHIREPESDE
ncbi:hypothetical protein KC19_VG290200 [Ceratodon purpureus]|uniref:Plastid lipid-associated protein/fibrillin conserved domain-containing protein n=1 Tax=Ceratodon purpureus TaxID=3225 RepID=A0A8T0HVA8_CERPU|nr:hypothetical protein KC19_VG290200 [Ceratodon purpureus]